MRRSPEPLTTIVRLLSDLDLVYVGGAVLPLYLDRLPIDEDVRVTEDVDCIVAATLYEYREEVGEALKRRGFSQDRLLPGDPICRWRSGPLIIDVMPIDERVLGFSNRWYAEGIIHFRLIPLPSGDQIRILPPGYFLATKIEAFRGRGEDDILDSHDFEDIVSLIDGCSELRDDLTTRPTVFAFVQAFCRSLLERADLDQIIEAHTPRRDQEARFRAVLGWITEMSK